MQKTETMRQLEFKFNDIAVPAAVESCGCGGNQVGCRTACVALDDGEHCSRCGAILRHRSGCVRCDNCGYWLCE